MNTKPARIRQILTDGTGRAVIYWLILMTIWLSLQSTQGMGIDSKLIQSYLVLALPLIVASIGVTLVIIMGQFDLSAAGVIAIVNVTIASTLSSWNPLLVVVLMVALGAFIGLVNGLFVILGKLPAIAVTLATLIILQGLAIVILPQPSGKVPPFLVDGVRAPFVAVGIIIVIIIAWMLFKRSRLGLYMFAIGADPEALHLSGLPVKKIQLKIFVISGALYGLAGVLMSASLTSGDANAADSFLLTTFAAAAIGGTAFVGGRGSAVGTLFGALTLLAIPKVLFVFGVSDWTQKVAFGLLVLLAVVAGAFSSLRKDREFLLLAPYSTPTEGEPSTTTKGGNA
jgi:ribose transport system permease protein